MELREKIERLLAEKKKEYEEKITRSDAAHEIGVIINELQEILETE